MTYEEFLEALKRKAHDELGFDMSRMKFYPKGFTSDDPAMIEWINDSNRRFVGEELNGVLLDDFLVMETEIGGIISNHRTAVRELYEEAEKNGLDEAFHHISDLQHNLEASEVDIERVNKRMSDDYLEIRDELIIRLLNYRLHMRELKGCVYRRVGDFVLCLYHLMGDANHSLITSKILRDDLKRWGMDGQDERVIDDAIVNTAKIYPACVYDNRIGKEADFLTGDFTRKDITMMGQLLLTTFKTTNGATAIFYPGVMEKMLRIMGGPYIVVFMNINDIMIFDKNDQRAYYCAQTAKKSGELGEMLSEKMYLCDGKNLTPGVVIKM